ncbi:xanthine dehydrogenase family protein molybdopterin-binding subunit [Streptomyces reniochalinae]|uniref:Xanthine dehydrogenase family protein molybdopterin-binding subunit n=1 Tax=Streptomyces reniochalinae TaxID=2250578 RepID=A0A367EDA1_9ACTN|nr:xanthine dehydrogenase family protein molybdopterin-binding subunit [Streptomyces reniochalinae]RCG16044.1 xanthine dehydrogenase family protein molybdopterin-binding subunit [Streptomyces reniochalinae]
MTRQHSSEPTGYVGQSVPRVEDERLLRGHGRYVDDIALPGTLEAAVLRSPHAHARITRLETAAARDLQGVHAVYTASDVAALKPLVNEAELRVPPGLAEKLEPLVRTLPMPLLAREKVVYAGQPVALVVADSRYLAEDALELVEIGYEPLPVVVDPERALEPGAPLVEESWQDNLALELETGVGAPDTAFREAAVVIEEEFAVHRHVPSPIETRGVLAAPGAYDGRLTVWANTQTPHRVRDHIAMSLAMPADDVHVVAVDVGGGFGQKGILYVEELLVPFAARALGRPVLWREDRNENLTAASHAREQTHRIALAADAEGRLLGLRDRILVNFGASTMTGLVVPYNSVIHLLGPYRVPHVDIAVRAALTHTTFTSPYRGAGRPEAVFAMERALDRLARRLGLEPSELRRRNLITPEEMPYRTGLLDRSGEKQEYDSGDFPELLRRAVDHIDLRGVRKRQSEAARSGDQRTGVGFAVYLEATGLGPFESARLTVRPNGQLRLAIGAPSQGQGHRTSMAQIAADAVGVPMESVDVLGGDTDAVPHGVGTIASRALVTAGNATHRAGLALRTRILDAAAERLGVPAEELSIDGTRVRHPGGAETALAALVADGAELSETAYFRPGGFTYASGAHAAVVDVDTRTGHVSIEKYVVVHDAGRIVNPVIAEGQITGGVAQGIAGALYEEMIYGPDGQPTTTTYMDYLLPTSSEIPDLHLDEIVTPSALNDLGVKGLGEGGAIAPQAVLTNAVEDALTPLGVVVRRGPLTPDRVRGRIREAQAVHSEQAAPVPS